MKDRVALKIIQEVRLLVVLMEYHAVPYEFVP